MFFFKKKTAAAPPLDKRKIEVGYRYLSSSKMCGGGGLVGLVCYFEVVKIRKSGKNEKKERKIKHGSEQIRFCDVCPPFFLIPTFCAFAEVDL